MLFKDLKATTIFKAFILSAILQTIILSITLATRHYIDQMKIDPRISFLISILYIFLLTLLSLGLMYLLFGFGGGMLV